MKVQPRDLPSANIRKTVPATDIPQIIRRCQIERTRYVAARNKFHRTVCTVCAKENVDQINEKILMGISIDRVMEEFDLTEMPLKLHWRRHIQPLLHSVMPPTDGPMLQVNLAKMVKRRANARLPRHDLKAALNFVLVDLMLMRRLCHGDITDDGLVIHGPNLRGILAVDDQIVKVARHLDKIEQEDRVPVKPLGKKDDEEGSIPGELVSPEQQKLIDEGRKRTEEAIHAATRGTTGKD